MKSFRLALVASGCAALCSAQFVPGVTTTTTMGTFFSYNIANLTNGVGLSAMDVTATHSANWPDMWTSNQITTGSLTFDFGSVVSLSAIAVWNYNSTISVQRGVATMDVLTSTDGSNFTPLSTETLPQSQAPQPIAAHLIQASGVAAQYVRFDVLSNYGDIYTGLSEVQFVPGGSFVVGTNTSLGQGCVRVATSFYELFPTSAAFDLANSGISMVPTGNGYVVLPGAAVFVPPSAGAVTLALTNNSQLPVTLAAPFPHPGGSTTTLQVCSNGFVSVASGNGTGAAPTAATMLNAAQTAWWAWHDYNPQAVGSGGVKFEQFGGVAYLTWDGVWDDGGTSTADASTFQFQFDSASGVVHLLFLTTSSGGNARLVGYSPGGASLDPGNTDLSVALPGSITLGNVDVLPLALAGGTRPVIGTSWTLNVTNVPATGTLGVEVFGMVDPGVPDLGFLGAPGCGSRASLDLLNVWVVAGATHSYSLGLPNVAAFVSLDVFTQAVVLQPGVNSLLGGVITSNGIDGKIGNL